MPNKKSQEVIKKILKKSQTVTLIGPFYKKKNGKIRNPAIFVDRGTKFRKKIKGLSIGDGDSYAGHLDIRLSPTKDYSDFAYVLFLLQQKVTKIVCLGFLGGRRDHEWINLGEIFAFLEKQKKPTEIILDDEVCALSAGRRSIHVQGVFSIFTLKKSKIQISGACKYQLKKPKYIQPLSSLGLSNIGYGTVKISSTRTFFLCKNK